MDHNNECQRCTYYLGNESTGRCKINPPVPFMGTTTCDMQAVGTAVWPIVWASDGCAKFEHAAAGTEAGK